MALQTSGAISINDIVGEFGGTAPHSLSEYYDAGSGSAQPLGLSSALFTVSGNNASWVNRSIDVSDYVNHTVRPVFLHTGMTNFTSDLQLDNIGFGTSLYTFSANATPWKTSQAGNQLAYASVTNFTDVSTTTTANGRWHRDQGGTPSGSTGLTTDSTGSSTGWYLYTETSSNYSSANKYWLQGPETVITSSNSTFYFSEARYGAGMGTLTVYLDVTNRPAAPASGTISLSDFYGAADSATPMSGTSGTIDSGFYPIYGYRLSSGGSIPTFTSSYNNNVGSLSNSTATPSGRKVVDVRRYSNPGFVGMTIYMDGSGGNSGWTRCDWSNAAGTSTGFFYRVDCNYQAETPSSPFTATARWSVGTNTGGSGTSFSGSPPVNFISGSGQNFTLTFT